MSDLINRADAIEAVAQQWLFEASVESPYVNDDDIGEYRKLAEKLFEDVPSAEAVQGWIPCSERLPSESGTYLVTTAKGAVWADHFYANSVDDRHWSYRTRRVPIAWMPMPKPYKGGDDEE